MHNLKSLRVLMLGDVVKKGGCLCVTACLPQIKKNHNIDVVIANGENSSNPNGISLDSVAQLIAAGVDVITTGNHAYAHPQADRVFESFPFVLRPANFHHSLSGCGVFVLDKGFCQIKVINLIGNVFMPHINTNPFEVIDELLKQNPCTITLIDFHAEATAEKKSLAFFIDGRASALVGTHTHVQTADEQILPNGTAYISDLGMIGPSLSVLGVEPSIAIKRQITGKPFRLETAAGIHELCGAIIDIHIETGRALRIERLKLV